MLLLLSLLQSTNVLLQMCYKKFGPCLAPFQGHATDLHLTDKRRVHKFTPWTAKNHVVHVGTRLILNPAGNSIQHEGIQYFDGTAIAMFHLIQTIDSSFVPQYRN